MSLALRHRPDQFHLTLDGAGWVPVADLLAALRISRTDLDAVVAGNDKQRFAVERGTDGVDRIRASIEGGYFDEFKEQSLGVWKTLSRRG